MSTMVQHPRPASFLTTPSVAITTEDPQYGDLQRRFGSIDCGDGYGLEREGGRVLLNLPVFVRVIPPASYQ
jgi:hypothetical protein